MPLFDKPVTFQTVAKQMPDSEVAACNICGALVPFNLCSYHREFHNALDSHKHSLDTTGYPTERITRNE